MRCITLLTFIVSLGFLAHPAAGQTRLTAVGQDLHRRYAGQLERLRTEIIAGIPQSDQLQADTLIEILASDALDAKLAEYVVLLQATPRGLAEFAQQGNEQTALVEKMLAAPDLMKRMLVADGAANGKYGRAMEIYTAIQETSRKAGRGAAGSWPPARPPTSRRAASAGAKR